MFVVNVLLPNRTISLYIELDAQLDAFWGLIKRALYCNTTNNVLWKKYFQTAVTKKTLNINYYYKHY